MQRLQGQGQAWVALNGEVVDDDLAVERDPRLPLALKPLHSKPGAAEDSGTQLLLEPYRELHSDRPAHEPVAVDHISLARRNPDREELSRQLAGEGPPAVPSPPPGLG